MTAVTSDPAVDETPEPDGDAATDDVVETTEEIVEQVHTALAIKPDQKKWTADQIAVMQALGWQDADQMTPAEVMFFCYFCAENRVNPLLRQAMPLKTKDGVIPIMQIAGMRKRADDTGEYEGLTQHFEFQAPDGTWHEGWAFDGVEPVACRIGVYKRGWREAVEGSIQTAEAKVYEPVKNAQGVTEWVLAERWKNLIRMLKTSAEADGLRRAFPQALSGFYTPEETRRIKAEREEAHLRKEATEARAARRAAYQAAQAHVPTEDAAPAEPTEVVEGVIVGPREPMTIGQTMAAARNLIGRAHSETPAPPEPGRAEEDAAPAEAPRSDLPAPAAAVEVPADLPLSEEQRADCLRAELTEQSVILGVSVERMTARFAPIYEGDPLSTWDSNVLLSVVAFFRPRVAKRLDALGRWEEAAAYREAGTDYVDRLDMLFGRSVQPVSDGS